MAVTTTYSFFSVIAEFGVNANSTGAQTAAGFALLSDGNLAFAFQTDEAVLPSQDLAGRVLTTTGGAVTADFAIQASAGDLETAPQVAALSNGNFVVAYTDSSAFGSTGGTSTAFRIFQPNATALPGQPTLFEDESDDQTAPSIAALGSGFVIVHLDQSGGSATVNAVTAQRYLADGTVNGANIVVANSANGSPIRAPKVTALTDGGFVVVWAADVLAGAGENYDIFAQRYGSTGALNGGQITINAEGDQQANPSVVALPGGGFTVAWEDEESGNAGLGNIDLVTVSGTGAVGSLTEVAFPGRQERPSLVALSPDILVLTYASDQNGNADVFATAISVTSGELLSFAIEEPSGTQNQPSSVALPSGAFITAWSDSVGTRISAEQNRLGRFTLGDTFSNSITGDQLQDTVDGDQGSDTIAGGDGDDLLQGNFDGDSISGGAGNDLIFAMTQAAPDGSGVADTLNGDNGDDTIRGSAGGDTVAGGGGNDIIGGGAGSDLLQGGLDSDTISGGEGDDLVFANSQASPAGSGVGDVLDGGAGNDTITGSGGADQIFGGTGNDSLTGGAGNDVLYGEAGNDTMLGNGGEDQYVVDDVGDVVTELAGEGSADTAFVSTSGWTSFADVEIVRLFGGAISVNGHGGNEQLVANSVIAGGSQLLGRGGDDVLWGSAFGDVLSGGSGSDTIRGGAGNDEMYGGEGVDIYVVEQLGDLLFEIPGDGYDTAYVTVDNYVMPESGAAFAANIEVAYLAGSAVFLNGSSSGENLVANPTAGSVLAAFGGNDILYGSDFGDSFTGGTGSDIIYSGGGADAIRFIESNWGFDQVSDFTPGAGDRLVFSAASGVTAFGQLAVLTNATDTQLSFGGNTILLYNYLGFNAGDVQFIA